MSHFFSVSSQDSGLRLDLFLKARFPNHSRSFLQWLIDEEKVLINDKIAKKREVVRVGNTITVAFEERPPSDLTPHALPLEILFEDEWLLVLNKPAGLTVHPGAGTQSPTLIQAVLFHCPSLPAHPTRPGIVHRLDKDTSGVMVIAKQERSHQLLVEAFSQRKVKKEYLAITIGTPKAQKITGWIARHPTRRQQMAVSQTPGKWAITHCTPLQTFGPLALVKLDLETGRTHQIRLHLQSIGHPILGDPVYGNPTLNERYKLDQQLLHASSLSFCHPITLQPLVFSAPPRPQMATLLTNLSNK